MFYKLWQKYRYWKCKRKFNKLPREFQILMEFYGKDPNSLKSKGYFS